jgi:hypothetical protein
MTTQSVTDPLAPTVGEPQPTRRTAEATRSPAGPAPQAAGMLWFGGWLFTIGFAKLVWWKALFGLIVWPYFLGETVR